MSKYQTRPLRQLKTYLSAHSQESFTVEELTEALAKEYGENAPGKSTLYRLLPRLEQEQTVKRFEKEGAHRPYYQMISCDHEHLHLKCTACGKLFHMNHKLSKDMESLLALNGFLLDTGKTTLLGTCKGCTQKVSL